MFYFFPDAGKTAREITVPEENSLAVMMQFYYQEVGHMREYILSTW